MYHFNVEKNIPAKKDFLWLLKPKFITNLAAIVYRGLSSTLHFREKPHTRLLRLLQSGWVNIYESS